MPQKQPHILFVSHNANRGGAPILLLEIIKAFRQQSSVPFQILLMHNGDLANEFKKLGTTYTWFRRHPDNRHQQTKAGIVYRITTILNGLIIFYSVRKNTLVFYNTIDNGHIQKKLLFLKAKSVYYIHELEASIRITTNAQTLRTIRENTNLFLTVSNAVKNNLVINHSIDNNRIKVMTTPFKHIERKKEQYKDFIAAFSKERGLANDTIVIGAMGQSEWRKGFDLFFPLVKLYLNLYPNDDVFFVWKGFNAKNLSAFFDLYQQEKYDLANKAVVLPHGKDAIDTMACFDVHLLLSREDPYPLVMVEAASFGIPTVCFSDGGGAPEFVESDAGYCTPYGDLLKMAEKIKMLVDDVPMRNKLGNCARQKVARHAFEKTIPDFITVIESQLT